MACKLLCWVVTSRACLAVSTSAEAATIHQPQVYTIFPVATSLETVYRALQMGMSLESFSRVHWAALGAPHFVLCLPAKWGSSC